MRHERDNAKQTLVAEKRSHKIEVAEWVDYCEKLSQSLGHYLERERSKFQQEAANPPSKTVMRTVEASIHLMPTFPGERTYYEINQKLREYKEGSE